MRARLPQKEPEILARWAREDLYGALRESAKGRPKFVLHDGPPYANGNVHIGTALNKILKDMVVRSHQMTGKDSNYVPGWDCHGLPIEWKVEEEFYRDKGKVKPDFSDPERPHRIPPGVSRLRRALDLGPARGVQATGRRRRLGSSLHDHELPGGSADREGNLQVHCQRPALPRLEAGHVERRRKDRAGGSRDRVRGLRPATRSLRGFPGRGRRLLARCVDLDDDAVDDSRQSRDRLFAPDRLRPLSRDARRPPTTGQRSARTYILADALARRACSSAGQESTRYERVRRRCTATL